MNHYAHFFVDQWCLHTEFHIKHKIGHFVVRAYAPNAELGWGFSTAKKAIVREL